MFIEILDDDNDYNLVNINHIVRIYPVCSATISCTYVSLLDESFYTNENYDSLSDRIINKTLKRKETLCSQ